MRFRRRLKILLLRPSRLHRAAGRRLVATLALLAFVATAVGLPLPQLGPDKDRSQPFPCADRPCGCRNAEQCWRGCCCFTMSEKLAWAREHGVNPPAYVVKAAEQQQVASRSCTKPGCQHCAHQAPATVTKSEQATTSCCADVSKCEVTNRDISKCDVPKRTAKSLSKPPASKCCDRPHRSATGASGAVQESEQHDTTSAAVIGVLAWRCQGGSPLWNAVGGCLPPPRPVAWSFDWRLIEHLPSADTIGISPGLDPPVPPPKLAFILG